MAEFLFDCSRDFFIVGCCTDGVFDPKKAAALGYSEAQFDAIKEFIGSEPEPEADADNAELEDE